jgi:hypothetical protein
MNENEDEKLWRALSVPKSDAFWRGQRKRILERIEERPSRKAVWGLAMAAASLALVFTLHRRPASPPTADPAVQELGMLQNLDLLEDMDVISTLPVKKEGS